MQVKVEIILFTIVRYINMFKSPLALKLLSLLILFSGIYCSNDLNDIDPDMIIYESEKLIIKGSDYKKHLEEQDSNYKSLTGEVIESFKKEFVREKLLLIEAYRKNYDENSELKAMVNRVARKIISQPGGLVYNSFILNRIQITDKMIEEIRSNLDRVIELEYIQFITCDDMKEYLNGRDSIDSISDFDFVVESSSKDKDVSHEKLQWNRTSIKFAGLRNLILSLGENNISRPIHNYGGVTVFKTGKITRRTGKNNFGNIDISNNETVRKNEEEYLAYKFDMKIFEESDMKINIKNAKKFWSLLNTNKDSFLEEKNYIDLLDADLMEYTIDSKRKKVTVKDYISFYNDLAMRSHLNEKRKFYYYLRDMAWEEHILKIAKDSGITREPVFLKEKSDYKNSILPTFYIRDRVKEIAEVQLREYYDDHREKYNLGTHVMADLYYYSNYRDAGVALRHLRKNEQLKFNNSPGRTGTGQKVIFWEDTDWPEGLIKEIFDSKYRISKRPYKVNEGKFVIYIRKSRSGKRYLPFPEVKELIHNHLYNREFERMKSLLADSLFHNLPDARMILDKIK